MTAFEIASDLVGLAVLLGYLNCRLLRQGIGFQKKWRAA